MMQTSILRHVCSAPSAVLSSGEGIGGGGCMAMLLQGMTGCIERGAACTPHRTL